MMTELNEWIHVYRRLTQYGRRLPEISVYADKTDTYMITSYKVKDLRLKIKVNGDGVEITMVTFEGWTITKPYHALALMNGDMNLEQVLDAEGTPWRKPRG